jgi:DNA transposition AAA+ family ATPase
MAEFLRIANAESRPRRSDEFVYTETARDILRSVELVRTLPGTAMTMITGEPGVGKTQALQHRCASEGFDAVYLSIANGEGKPTAIATNLLRMYRTEANGMSLSAMRDTLAQYIGRGRLLVLDEAQYLDPNGAEWVRALAEDGGFDLILSGDLALRALVARIPQLYSRMIRPVVVKTVTRADVAAMVEGTALATTKAIDALHAVARMKGGLRNVENVTRITGLFAGGDRPTVDHLKAAIIDMKLAPKGGV